jgi:uncharacterized protein YndB with AHSA1/START domain
MTQDLSPTPHQEEAAGSLEHSFVIEQMMTASSDAIYDAWVHHFDTWFASPGEIAMNAIVGQPFWCNVAHEGKSYAHYGRFLALRPGALIEHTWVTGRDGTNGAETIVRVELSTESSDTRLVMSHGGFYDADDAQRHQRSWPRILRHLDAILTTATSS